MSFIMKISQELDYCKKNINDLIYLSVKKPQYAWAGHDIALFKDNNDFSGFCYKQEKTSHSSTKLVKAPL